MTQTRVIIACPTCEVFWPQGDEPSCTDPGHPHPEHEVHLHRETVRLPDGHQITGASFDPADPYTRATRPDYGLYLDPRWDPPWPHAHLPWPDFDVPQDPELLRTELTDVLVRIGRGGQVEIGCLGGHGRTGTALACIAVLAGESPTTAASWVRSNYCPAAVETATQDHFIATFR